MLTTGQGDSRMMAYALVRNRPKTPAANPRPITSKSAFRSPANETVRFRNLSYFQINLSMSSNTVLQLLNVCSCPVDHITPPFGCEVVLLCPGVKRCDHVNQRRAEGSDKSSDGLQ